MRSIFSSSAAFSFNDSGATVASGSVPTFVVTFMAVIAAPSAANAGIVNAPASVNAKIPDNIFFIFYSSSWLLLNSKDTLSPLFSIFIEFPNIACTAESGINVLSFTISALFKSVRCFAFM